MFGLEVLLVMLATRVVIPMGLLLLLGEAVRAQADPEGRSVIPH
jgi:hypothetical protein